MSKLDEEYQAKWTSRTLFDAGVLSDIGTEVQLHTQLDHVLSSAAACLNVLGNLRNGAMGLAQFLNRFGLAIDEVVLFPTNCTIDGETYDDKGHVIFEWIGPGKSTLNERGGKRGQNRTSIDAYVLARISGKLTQILIEWKFSETYKSDAQHQKFGGARGIERARRYSAALLGGPRKVAEAEISPVPNGRRGRLGFPGPRLRTAVPVVSNDAPCPNYHAAPTNSRLDGRGLSYPALIALRE